MRDWIIENSALSEYSNIVGIISEKSGVKTINYYGDQVAKRDKDKCNKTKGLLGYYDPSRRQIMLCTNNYDGNGEGEIVNQHEMVHAAQHCYGGTLSRNPYLKSLYFNMPAPVMDVREVVELYPEGAWVDELEARAGVVNGYEIDYAALLYLACKVF